ncbi:hypothetical protein BJ170DRAFT_679187 [Xylariales sp. AK1849]|nr:hypothetical protein BJ170DRAFT_679187 [Xylariales sp. AK1849]
MRRFASPFKSRKDKKTSNQDILSEVSGISGDALIRTKLRAQLEGLERRKDIQSEQLKDNMKRLLKKKPWASLEDTDAGSCGSQRVAPIERDSFALPCSQLGSPESLNPLERVEAHSPPSIPVDILQRNRNASFSLFRRQTFKNPHKIVHDDVEGPFGLTHRSSLYSTDSQDSADTFSRGYCNRTEPGNELDESTDTDIANPFDDDDVEADISVSTQDELRVYGQIVHQTVSHSTMSATIEDALQYLHLSNIRMPPVLRSRDPAAQSQAHVIPQAATCSALYAAIELDELRHRNPWTP